MKVALACLLVAVSPMVAQMPPTPGAWRQAPLWDLGSAEFSGYEVSWQRYGKTWKGRALIVVVKETWAPDLDVKADRARPDGFEVLKLNHVRDVQTGIYRYHQMASAFVRRQDGGLRKMSTSSTEACGLTTADLRNGALRTRSYFDEQGDREIAWPKGAVPFDALPMMGRDLVRPSQTKTIELFPSLLNGRLPPLKARAWSIARQVVGDVATPGLRAEATEVRLTRGKRHHKLVFESGTPHRMLSWEHPDGSTYTLAKTDLLKYWDMNTPGGEAWWPASLR